MSKLAHKKVLSDTASEFNKLTSNDLTNAEIDQIIELYFLNLTKSLPIEEGQKRSITIQNKNVASFWQHLDKGDNGKNSLGGIEKESYLKLKVRFSKGFYEKVASTK